ncbi:MAG: hypothetical protein NC251_04270 [Lachnoclostridium sp.]|nr:hypothetical protein [Lachnospira sp.]MCM1247628.1 hypothetical protein [Lachnoclostridium sp.]
MTAQEIVDTLNSHGSDNFSLCCKLEELIDQNNIDEAITCIQNRFKCNREIAIEGFTEFKKQIYSEFKKIENENTLTPEQIAYNNMVARDSLNKPKCPTCQSANLKKITTTSKVVNTAMFGIFGTKRHKTFHCNNCGYEW